MTAPSKMESGTIIHEGTGICLPYGLNHQWIKKGDNTICLTCYKTVKL